MIVRFGILVALLALVAAADFYKNRGAARKWREYGLMLIGGAIGALFGALNDAFITSHISPEYFIHGKGIAPGDGFQLRVALLGVQAGLGPGLIGMGVYLYINTRKPASPQLPLGRLIVATWMPLVAAALLGAVMPPLFGARDPFGFAESLKPLMPPDRSANFLRAWWTHLGIYAGCLVGLVAGAVSLHRKRQFLILTSPRLE